VTQCNPELIQYPRCKRRKVEVDFQGGSVTSDGGSLHIQQADQKLGLLEEVAKYFPDPRRSTSITHDTESLLRQRVFSLCLGYEDLNDHADLRLDPAIQTTLGKDTLLASAPTLCRFENYADREVAGAIHEIFIEKFIQSFDTPPEKLILDFDATDDEIHGNQAGRFYHGYYRHYCFLPLYVFCNKQLLVSYLRPSKIDGAKHTGAILSLLVKRLRKAWPNVQIIFRADGGFCRHHVLTWCERERNHVDYIVGYTRNSRLETMTAPLIDQSAANFDTSGEKQRLFGDLTYGAFSWGKERRVIVKAEHNHLGPNTRYVVTNMSGDPQELYDDVYCHRGEMENRIKEQQMDLFADRTSCSKWWPNQFRLLLSSLAYVLMETIRRVALVGTELENATCNTIRLKLFKVGAVITRNTRRVRFHLSSAYPLKELFRKVQIRLNPG